MAAIDAFEWFVSTMVKNPSEKILAQIKAQRAYMHSLRSEDERQRYVEAARDEIRELSGR